MYKVRLTENIVWFIGGVKRGKRRENEGSRIDVRRGLDALSKLPPILRSLHLDTPAKGTRVQLVLRNGAPRR